VLRGFFLRFALPVILVMMDVSFFIWPLQREADGREVTFSPIKERMMG
jgi:hypothetical protein